MNHCGVSGVQVKGMAYLGQVIEDTSASHEKDVVDIQLCVCQSWVFVCDDFLSDGLATTSISFCGIIHI